LESRHSLPVNYLAECGSRVTNEMRATLVNWLVEIHGHLKLEPETLHVAVKLLDATLHRFNVGVTRLQLCGLAVFWIASKLENNPPAVIFLLLLSLHKRFTHLFCLQARELLQLMCHTGDATILVRMEEQVLKVLNFQIQAADPIFFLNRLLLYDENGNSEEVRFTVTAQSNDANEV
jgi:Cyclin, N-terminal domain